MVLYCYIIQQLHYIQLCNVLFSHELDGFMEHGVSLIPVFKGDALCFTYYFLDFERCYFTKYSTAPPQGE